jgi:hypothetical protein
VAQYAPSGMSAKSGMVPLYWLDLPENQPHRGDLSKMRR